MSKEKKKGKYLLSILVLLMVLTINIILYVMSQKIKDVNIFDIGIKIQFIFWLCYLLLSAFKFDGLFRKMQSLVTVALVAAFSLLLAYLIYDHFSKSTPITQGEALTFYGEYIAFLGTFSLGYFIYKKDENQRIEEKKNKCKMLLYCIDKADIDMMRIARHNFKQDKIIYDSNWREYYLEFESLTKRKHSEAKYTLNSFFDTVDLMNLNLIKGDYAKAKIVFENHVSDDCYSTRKYNLLESKMLIQDATYINETSIRMNLKPWDEKSEVKKAINEYTEKFFGIVENYIYNYMMQNNKTVLDCKEIDKQLVDWLSSNLYIKNIAKWPNDKRIVAKIIFNISLQLDKKSKRLSYCWAEYTLK
jgi:hypothetical protein